MAVPVNEKLMTDFIVFTKYQLASKDVDPMYPVLKALHDGRDYTLEQRVWHCFYYQAWYNLVSVEQVIRYNRLTLQEARYPTGIERRGFRNGHALLKHIADLERVSKVYGSMTAWVTKCFKEDREYNWLVAMETVQEIWGNGRWAAYKACELMQKVCGLNLSPSDMGHEHSSGPRKGLALLYPAAPPMEDNSPEAIRVLNLLGVHLSKQLENADVHPSDIGEVETCLCDFHTMWEGRYYVGYDIDMMLQNMLTTKKLDRYVSDALTEARIVALPRQYLGELQGWKGIDKPRCQAYRDKNQILIRT